MFQRWFFLFKKRLFAKHPNMDEFLKLLEIAFDPLPYLFCNMFVMLFCFVQKNSYEMGLFVEASLPFWPWWLIPWPYSIEPLQGPAVRISFIVALEPNPISSYRFKKPSTGQTKQKWSSDPVSAFRHWCFSPPARSGPKRSQIFWAICQTTQQSMVWISRGILSLILNGHILVNEICRTLSTWRKTVFVFSNHCYGIIVMPIDYRTFVCWSSVEMADRDVLELANDEEFGDGGMDDMEGEVWSFFKTLIFCLKIQHCLSYHILFKKKICLHWFLKKSANIVFWLLWLDFLLGWGWGGEQIEG